MNKVVEADVSMIKRFQKSPILFVEKIWKLIPQPIKPEHRDTVEKLVSEARLIEIKKEYFQPFIKGSHITWQQWLTLTAVELAIAGKASRRISIVSGHGTGKSGSMALILLWFLFCHKNAQIPCTAPTSNQMHDILWKEVSLWLKRMPKWAQEKYEWSSEYIRIVESPATWFARAKTASKENSEALAGIHGDHVLTLVDEASGVFDDIFETAEGALTGPNVLFMMFSNGTRLTGYFFDSHHNDSHNYQTLSFNAEDSPIVEKAFTERIAERFGRDSDEYSIRVTGGFGKEEGVDDQGYQPLLVDTDFKKAIDPDLRGRIKLGIDPAGDGGDGCAQVARDNYKAKLLYFEKSNTSKTIAGAAVGFMKSHGITGNDVAVDNFGIGADVPLEIALADNNNPIRVNGVNVGDDAHEKDVYFNRRAELAWAMRKWIKTGGEIVNLDNEFKEELLALRFRRTAGKISKIELMPKRVMKKLRLNHGKSPNKADALMLTFNSSDEIIKTYVQPPYEPMSEYET